MRAIINAVQSKILTGTSAKTLLRHILDHPSSLTAPLSDLIDELSLRATAPDDSSLRLLCQKAINALPKEAESARRGNEKVVMRLVGWAMKESKGTADARAVADVLRSILSPSSKS